MANLVQINADGSMSVDVDPPAVPYEDQVTIIKDAFAAEGWNVLRYDEDKAHRRHLVEIEKSGETIDAILYVFSPFNYSQPRNDLSEKRIQLGTPSGSDKAQRDHDFALPTNGTPRCALLGIYRRDNLVLFGAWVAANYVGHKTNPNLWMKGDPLLAAAARTGFARDLNSHKDILCAFVPRMLPAYLHDMGLLHGQAGQGAADAEKTGDENQEKAPDTIQSSPNPISVDLPHNRIFYGAPGTGKSHNLNLDLGRFFPGDDLFERTTFYPDTTSGTFMGSYRPTPIYRSADGQFLEADRKSAAPNFEPIIDYRFVPGPFLRLLAKALANPDHNFCLVIEEINRANASAVFADAFQLLDRDDEGKGKFAVVLPPEATDFLATYHHHGPVRIPSNMYIWATMNSADQGVLPLDSAFKRRWTMEYVGLNDGESVVQDWELELSFLDQPIKWNAFRNAINAHLERQGIAEDRLLGPFFMTRKDLARPRAFENKLLQYLRDDVVRNAPGKLFAGGSSTFGALVGAYRQKTNIFVPEITFGDS